MSVLRSLLLASFSLAFWLTPQAVCTTQAQAQSEQFLRIRYTPTERAQVAIWVEREDGTFVGTIGLTQATSYRGIGNRPGAMTMNSGFRWPYGRREGVLPVWAHRRASAEGAKLFPRVIFQDRTTEGLASRTSNDASPDEYYCLSFNQSLSEKDALDAMTCASVFSSDKGRYITQADVGQGYAEPYEDATGAMMRPLSLYSVYPPRRDITRCTTVGCADHPDTTSFAQDARSIMPAIDEVTMATPAGGTPQNIQFDVPPTWERGRYVLWLEVNVEGDYSDAYNASVYPTPTDPSGMWDSWAMSYGYPYRGQPSAVYKVPFELGIPTTRGTRTPAGSGDLHGVNGELYDAALLVDDPSGAPGSGADRLLYQGEEARLSVEVVSGNVCGGPNPPAECGRECSSIKPCSEGFVCSPDFECLGYCDVNMPPQQVAEFTVDVHPDEKRSEEWAVLRFVVPSSIRELQAYDVRVSKGEPIVDSEGFMRALPANAATVEDQALEIPIDAAPGDIVEVEFGGLSPETQYFVALRAVDVCNDAGPIATAEVTTTPITFATVSPCFVATATYGSALADEVHVLRRFRDRHLMPNAPGRALVRAYYAVGPQLARVVENNEIAKVAAQMTLAPIVAMLQWWDA